MFELIFQFLNIFTLYLRNRKCLSITTIIKQIYCWHSQHILQSRLMTFKSAGELLGIQRWQHIGLNTRYELCVAESTIYAFTNVLAWLSETKVKKANVIRCRLLYCALVPDICECNSLLDMTFNFCDLWPSDYVRVNFTLISRCT